MSQDIDVGQFSEALNDKMDLDGGNAVPPIVRLSDIATLQAKILELEERINNMSGLGRIDYTNVITDLELNVPKGGQAVQYTVPFDGYIFIHSLSLSATLTGYPFSINNKEAKLGSISSSAASLSFGALLPVSQGDILKLEPGYSGANKLVFNMYPQKTN